jgi:hypothetical protein
MLEVALGEVRGPGPGGGLAAVVQAAVVAVLMYIDVIGCGG